MACERCLVVWDYENVALPSSAKAHDVVAQLRRTLKPYGRVEEIKLYASATSVSAASRTAVRDCGVQVCDVPSGRKDAVDKVILTDMLLWTRLVAAPATIVLISGDRDYSYPLSCLGSLGYNIVLISAAGSASAVLRHVADQTLKWSDIVAGKVSPPVPKTAPAASGKGKQSKQTQQTQQNKQTQMKKAPAQQQKKKTGGAEQVQSTGKKGGGKAPSNPPSNKTKTKNEKKNKPGSEKKMKTRLIKLIEDLEDDDEYYDDLYHDDEDQWVLLSQLGSEVKENNVDLCGMRLLTVLRQMEDEGDVELSYDNMSVRVVYDDDDDDDDEYAGDYYGNSRLVTNHPVYHGSVFRFHNGGPTWYH